MNKVFHSSPITPSGAWIHYCVVTPLCPCWLWIQHPDTLFWVGTDHGVHGGLRDPSLGDRDGDHLEEEDGEELGPGQGSLCCSEVLPLYSPSLLVIRDDSPYVAVTDWSLCVYHIVLCCQHIPFS